MTFNQLYLPLIRILYNHVILFIIFKIKSLKKKIDLKLKQKITKENQIYKNKILVH